MFGIANQLLAVIALAVITAWIVNEGRAWYVPVTLIPLAWTTTMTLWAGSELIVRFYSAGTPVTLLNMALVIIMLGLVLLVLGDSARVCLTGVRFKKEPLPADK
jgi:carbon starvation protein